MRFHIHGLPHTSTSRNFSCCAFTHKIRGFCTMMQARGHEVIHYGSEDSEADCSEHVTVMTREEREAWFPGDWRKRFFPVNWDAREPYWQKFNTAVIEAMRPRLRPHDFICLLGGNAVWPIAEAFPHHLVVEYGIGYDGPVAKFKVFESYAQMHYVYGLNRVRKGNYFDDVVPNYYSPWEFPLADKKSDYYLFMGRLGEIKGPHIAAEVCAKLGVRLLVAGQGAAEVTPGKIVCTDGTIIKGPVEYLGVLEAHERAQVMGQALALFAPTQYMEPFGSVTMEAAMCGTPVITTDWGCFTETVVQGVNGYRTRTFSEMIDAAIAAPKLNPMDVRRHTIDHYCYDVVGRRYQRYFDRLEKLWGQGWYA